MSRTEIEAEVLERVRLTPLLTSELVKLISGDEEEQPPEDDVKAAIWDLVASRRAAWDPDGRVAVRETVVA